MGRYKSSVERPIVVYFGLLKRTHGMVTRLVVLNVPPVKVPPRTSVDDAPGVELVKLI